MSSSPKSNLPDRAYCHTIRAHGIPSRTIAHLEEEDFQLWACYMSSRLRAAVQAGRSNPSIHPGFLFYLQQEVVRHMAISAERC